MGLTIVDAGVVIALLDADDAHHGSARDHLRAARDRDDRLVLPASAYAETLVRAFRSGDDAAMVIDSLVDALPLVVHAIDRAAARLAARLRAQHRALRLPDALVIAVGLQLEAAGILTTDRGWPSLGIPVTVV